MTEDEIRDWYRDSVCGLCKKEDCWGECPGYKEYEQKIIEQELKTGVCAPVIPCQSIKETE